MQNPDAGLLFPVHNKAGSIENNGCEIYGELSQKVNVGFIMCEDGSRDAAPENLRRLAQELPIRLNLRARPGAASAQPRMERPPGR